MLGIGESADFECVELAGREVASAVHDEPEDRSAVEFVDHVYRTVGPDFDSLMPHTTHVRAIEHGGGRHEITRMKTIS